MGVSSGFRRVAGGGAAGGGVAGGAAGGGVAGGAAGGGVVDVGAARDEMFAAAAALAGRLRGKLRGCVAEPDCVSFFWDKGGHACCNALKAPYCLEDECCVFRITRADADRERFRAGGGRIGPHL